LRSDEKRTGDHPFGRVGQERKKSTVDIFGEGRGMAYSVRSAGKRRGEKTNSFLERVFLSEV